MEYMSGGSLYDLVQKYPIGFVFSEAEVAYIIAETLNAVAFLHSLKRIHRDIKVRFAFFSRFVRPADVSFFFPNFLIFFSVGGQCTLCVRWVDQVGRFWNSRTADTAKDKEDNFCGNSILHGTF